MLVASPVDDRMSAYHSGMRIHRLLRQNNTIGVYGVQRASVLGARTPCIA